ncbi:hypothetical protein A6A04_09765 [Paramagnetospirillum marisnigri]|uniref:Uncharacterized protein n=1 Tax=Paramagnetospirillum marisnigri TaxID=1285242 RepID=A0A178M402_9PROT|nr:hypothetical protein [Paramagnetospirillum marisnigri]OAN42981.1 hypothetical protein A6A04_09765 [Paramagnetospirillum marisnigri]
MRILLTIVILAISGLAAPGAALAQDYGRLVAQVALQPLPEGETPDIDALLKTHWRAYYNGGGQFGFFRDQVRAGRIDLNEDGRTELFLLIDAPAWASAKGQPMVVAQWTSKGWAPIGWGFGEADGVFVTSSRLGGWATIETPSQWFRWNGASYQPLDRPQRR